MPPNRPKRAAAVMAAQVIRKKLRGGGGDSSHTFTAAEHVNNSTTYQLEEWNAAVQRQEQIAVREQRLDQMMHPSRAARLYNNNNRQGVPRSHQQQQPPSLDIPAQGPKSTRVAAYSNNNSSSNNGHVHQQGAMEVDSKRVVQEVVGGAPRQPPPPFSYRSAVWRQSSTHNPATGYDAEVPPSRPANSAVTSSTASTAVAAYAADATVGRDAYSSSSSWNEFSVAARQGMSVSQPIHSSTVARAASASTALEEQDRGNESDSWHSSSSSSSWEDEETTAQSRKRRKKSKEALRQPNKKSMKQNRNEKRKQKALLKQGKGVCCESSILVPHKKLLQRFVCTSCSTSTDATKALFYAKARKAYNMQYDLVQVIARPDPATRNVINSMQDKAHVPKGSRRNHLVLAGSMTRKNASAMVNEINGIVGTPRRLEFVASGAVLFAKKVGGKNGKHLCLKLKATDTQLELALEKAREQDCVLPQRPISIVLGAPKIHSAVKKLNDRRASKTLVFDSLAILDSKGRPTVCVPVDSAAMVNAEQAEPAGQPKTKKAQESVVDSQDSAQMYHPPGANLTVDRAAQCDTCTFIPHPSRREAVVCCECGHEKSARNSIVAFNNLRQLFLRDRHSLRITAKLDERSCTLIEPLAENAASTTVFCERITLVDGLTAWSIQSTSLLNDIQHAIQLSPALQIVGSRVIPTSDTARTGLQFLVIDLLPEPALHRVLAEAAQSSLVAQAPLCVSIGLVEGSSNAITDIVKCFIGSSLFLDAGSVASQSDAV